MAQIGRLFNGEQQLSSSFVHNVFQDKSGFIWVSTESGLNRYDGYTFLTFTEADGLTGQSVNCSMETKEDNLIAGTTTGAFVKINGRFLPVTIENSGASLIAHVTSFAKTPKGDIVICTSGAGLFIMTGETTAMPIDSGDRDLVYSRSVIVDRKGTIWVGTDSKGIIALSPYKKNGRTDYKKWKTILPDSERQLPILCADKYNNIFVGFFNGGLYRINSSRNTLDLVPLTATLPISQIKVRKDDQLFIGTNGFGLKVFNPKTNIIRDAYVSTPLLDLSRTKVVSILEDKHDNLWLGLFQKGVFCQNRSMSIFSTLGIKQGKANEIGEACIMAVENSRDNETIWTSADQNGLYHLDSNHRLIRHYQPTDDPKSVPHTILSVKEDKKGHLWIASYMKGCGWFDIATGEYHRASFSYGKAQNVFDMRCDHKGRMWIATLGDGLKCYDPETDKLTEYRSKEGVNNSLINNYIFELEFNHDKDLLFIGTSQGLACLDTKTGNWTNVFGKRALCEGQAVRAICSSSKTGLWIGTAKGLYNYDIKTRKLKLYTTKDGLPNNNISSIEVDRKGEVWVATSYGLCNINLKNNTFRTYYATDGLQGNEYSEGASSIDKQGTLYFCGTQGISIIDTHKNRQDTRKPRIVMSRMEVSGERVMSSIILGNYVVTREAVSNAKHFDFSHDDNNITMYFSTLSFAGIDHVSYSYRINGGEWIKMADGVNSLTLSRLAPGDYNFEVIANDNGAQSDIKEFTIVVHNPWYFTPFARFVYLIIIIGMVLWYISDQKIKHKQKLDLQEHIHAEQLNEQRLHFFVNMSHEIRTPMTLIIAPLLQLIKEDNDHHRQATYEIIKRNAERILHLVNQIMDIRKIDQNQMQLQMRETDMVAYIKNTMTLFAAQAKSKMVKYEFKHEKDKSMLWIDRYQFDKVIINLLSNAFKYVNTGGIVTIMLKETADKAIITVFDDGEQIPEENLKRIFERFYQTANDVNQTKAGTGVGLDLTRSLVELHHGEIEARNMENGVEFIVTLPLGNLHLKPEEISPLGAEEVDHTDIDAELLDSQAEEYNEESDDTKDLLKQPQSKRPTIIIVEDDDEIRNYLMAELSSTYRTLSYPNGTDALPAILREIPQLVISDIMMPGMDGTTLCAKVKANVNTNHIPVILLTAKTRDEDRLEGLESGADLYITKPFNMDIMRRSISNLLSTRKLMQNKFTGKEDLSEQVDEVQMETADEKLLTRIMTVINANLNNSDLNIDMICTEVGISRVHLHRKMKELTNQTPHDFIRNLRLKQAARLLSKKGQSITEVMYRCGFNSATSFSTMFKKMYGLSPRDYMKEHAGE